jgi:SWIM zinc finger
MSGRLARGRNYARRGQVLGFELTQGRVSAQVQGSRPTPYQTRIGVLPLTTAQWRRVEQALGAQALFRAKLLAGEMPPEIEEVFAACGTPLFPRSARDLDWFCSCPDWEVPCKHLAAVCYVLAERFDDDPFAMLAWRGRGREELLAALRRARGGAAGARGGAAGAQGGVGRDTGGATAGATAGAPAGPGGSPLAGRDPAPALAQCTDRFWSPGISRARLRAVPPVPPAPPDLLLRSAEPPPVTVRGQPLAGLLAAAYQRLAAQPETGGDTPGTLPG